MTSEHGEDATRMWRHWRISGIGVIGDGGVRGSGWSVSRKNPAVLVPVRRRVMSRGSDTSGRGRALAEGPGSAEDRSIFVCVINLNTLTQELYFLSIHE